MEKYEPIKPEDLKGNPFQKIGKDWMLITAGKEGKVNAMTASWGGLGVMWGKNVAFVVIRPQRYTKEFIDDGQFFSLGFLNRSFRKELNYLGTVSGREEDKILKSGLSVHYEEEIPYFEEAEVTLFCKKLYAQEMQSQCFLEEGILEKWYPGQDYHTLYIAEIVNIFEKE